MYESLLSLGMNIYMYINHAYFLQENKITGSDRDHLVRWMEYLKDNLSSRLGPDTYFMAILTFDRFLGSVEARPRHLKCIALTCLVLAAKICEEETVRFDSSRSLLS